MNMHLVKLKRRFASLDSKFYRKQSLKIGIILIFILVIMIFKKVNYGPTNKVLGIIRTNITYEFNFKEDGGRIFRRTKALVNNSLESIGVFNPDEHIQYYFPIQGEIYRHFGEKVVINGEKVKNQGIDMVTTEEQTPRAIDGGLIKKVQELEGKGYFITIEKDDIEIIYGYLSSTHLKEGIIVEEGDSLGTLGVGKNGDRYIRLEMFKNGEAVNPERYLIYR